MSSTAVAERPRKGRLGSRVKSNGGCLTCKIRKVKCGEEKPACRRCLSTGRKCDGYVTAINSRQHAPVAPASPTPAHVGCISTYAHANRLELQAFEFFIGDVLPGFSRIVDRRFWHQVIPQLSQSDKIIWDAVNALSCLIRHPQISWRWLLPGPKASALADDNHRLAVKWYSKSLRGLQKRMTHGSMSPGMLMVTCLLYISIECLQDNLDAAMVLYYRALAINGMLAEKGESDCSTTAGRDLGSVEGTVQSLLRHMSISRELPTSLRKTNSHINTTFNSLSEVREEGYLVLDEVHEFLEHIDGIRMTMPKAWLPTSDLIEWWEKVRTRIRFLETAIQEVVKRRGRSISECPDEDELYSTLMLSFNHFYIVVSSSVSMYQTALDEFMFQFRSVIAYARRVVAIQRTRSRRPVFVFETRILPALYYVATKCRHPLIRREAIFLLENEAPRMEYIAKAEGMAAVAKRIVGIEEACGSEQGVFHEDCPSHKVDLLPAEDHRIYRERLTALVDTASGEPIHFLEYGIWRRAGDGGAWIPTKNVVKV
ncbi:hypothetical protein A1O7_08813 [Cladophialophora yegresii CBS 114405]|uniref:Zn(2)-C6 fungal-type domain-containing protein n=1 Tax=Cladophialophora yegresii CBS 114405 TaxID=1182544 RepID=W9VJQ0_9EURO|nr:uncharacterized protein A1O7_08813 [Cladophialophora yegresii CBS 114405]EXJ55882.1 hypothetical protein A1O7_08813 [Cladophialophora yegresii CBS 114405]